jgi:hypothetical protein
VASEVSTRNAVIVAVTATVAVIGAVAGAFLLGRSTGGASASSTTRGCNSLERQFGD